MDTYNVLHTMVIGKNTAVVVDRAGEEFRNGIEIKDENDQTYKLLSIGLVGGRTDESSCNRTSILIEGIFSSEKIII